MKATEISIKNRSATDKGEVKREQKPRFRPAEDDTKPILQDPILRSDPIETEEAVLRLPPFPIIRASSRPQ